MLPSWRGRRAGRQAAAGPEHLTDLATPASPRAAGGSGGDGGGRTGWKKWALGTLKWGSHRRPRAARHRGRRRLLRLQPDRHPAAQRARRQAGLDRLLRRRQDRARPHRRRGGQPRVGRAVEGAEVRPGRPHRRRGPHLLREQRHLGRRHPARRQDEHHRRDPGRWLDDHPAVRQELLPHPGPHPDPQGPRDPHRRQDRRSAESKDEILEKYLNTIYYGRGAYGIQSAAKAYFGKDVSKLTVAEGAVLASVINAPSLFDPANGEKAQANLEKRYAYVLDGMVEEGWLSAAERAKYDRAAQDPRLQGQQVLGRPQRLHHRRGEEGAALDRASPSRTSTRVACASSRRSTRRRRPPRSPR